MCLANGLTDAFALEARPSSATYNPVTAAAWNAANQAKNANEPASMENMSEMGEAARSEAEAKMLGAPALSVPPGGGSNEAVISHHNRHVTRFLVFVFRYF